MTTVRRTRRELFIPFLITHVSSQTTSPLHTSHRERERERETKERAYLKAGEVRQDQFEHFLIDILRMIHPPKNPCLFGLSELPTHSVSTPQVQIRSRLLHQLRRRLSRFRRLTLLTSSTSLALPTTIRTRIDTGLKRTFG